LAEGSYTVVAYGFSDENRNINFKFGGTPREIETWRGAIRHLNSRWGGNVPGDFPMTIDTMLYVHVVGSFKFRPLDPSSPASVNAGSAITRP
jgi:hypothetical protein